MWEFVLLPLDLLPYCQFKINLTASFPSLENCKVSAFYSFSLITVTTATTTTFSVMEPSIRLGGCVAFRAIHIFVTKQFSHVSSTNSPPTTMRSYVPRKASSNGVMRRIKRSEMSYYVLNESFVRHCTISLIGMVFGLEQCLWSQRKNQEISRFLDS